jgi:RNA polymerase sigma-70 factor (ECF subfamily)
MSNPPPKTPVSLVGELPSAGALQGDDGALYAALRPELLRFACWLTADRVLAEDVVQEALLRAWRSRESLKDPAAAKGWLLTIVRREHARLFERKRLETVDLHAAIEREDSALAEPADGELIGLRQAIMTLPDEYRVPLVMQVNGGFTTEEIARELELSVPAVLTRLFRARNRLRSLYGLAAAPSPAEKHP